MKTIELIQNFGIFTIGTVSILGAVSWILKSVFTNWINNRAESLKNDLVRVIESHKAELQKLNNEHQIKFTRLHQEQANTIKQLYKLLINLEKSMDNFFKPQAESGKMPNKDDGITALNDFELFKNNYIENRIFFGPSICEIVDRIIIKIDQTWEEYNNLHFNYQPNNNNEWVANKRNREKLSVSHKIIKDEIPLIKTELENQFRTLLGVS